MNSLNYPTGSDNQFAPWNAPCTDAAEGWALRQLTGDDCDLTSETFATFMESCGEEREPVISEKAKPYIVGPISNMDLFKTMARSDDYAHCAAATYELMARYLADDFTTKNFDSLVEQAAEVLA